MMHTHTQRFQADDNQLVHKHNKNFRAMDEHVTPQSSEANNNSCNDMLLSTECFEETEAPAIRQYCGLGYATNHTNKTINQDTQVQQQQPLVLPPTPPTPPTPRLTAPEQPNPEPTPAPVTPIDHQPHPIPRSKGSYHNIIIEIDRLKELLDDNIATCPKCNRNKRQISVKSQNGENTNLKLTCLTCSKKCYSLRMQVHRCTQKRMKLSRDNVSDRREYKTLTVKDIA